MRSGSELLVLTSIEIWGYPHGRSCQWWVTVLPLHVQSLVGSKPSMSVFIKKKNGELDTADSSYAWLTQICWQPQKEIHRAGKHGSFTLSFLIFVHGICLINFWIIHFISRSLIKSKGKAEPSLGRNADALWRYGINNEHISCFVALNFHSDKPVCTE